MFKKLICLLMVVVFCFSVAGCGGGGSAPAGGGSGEEQTVTFKIGHIRPDGSPADNVLKLFRDRVAEATDGTLNIEIYPASQLGDYAVVEERVSIGDVEMQMATLGTNLDKSFGMASAPYLATNWEEAYEVFNSGSPYCVDVGERLAKNDMTLLAVYPLYFGGMILEELPDDYNGFSNKGIKIRVPSMKCYEENAQMLGYIPTPMAFSDTFTAMQTGVVNGILGAGAEGYYGNFRDLSKYYLAYNDHFEIWFMYVNTQKFEALSERQQEALKTYAKQLEEERWAVAPAETDEYERLLEENGTVLVHFTDAEIDAFAQKAMDEVWPAIKHDYDEQLFDSIAADIMAKRNSN